MATPMGERMAAVETELKNLNEAVLKLDGKMDAFILSAVTHSQLNEKLDTHNRRMDRIDSKIDAITRKRWVQNTLSAVLGVVLTSLVGYIILNILEK